MYAATSSEEATSATAAITRSRQYPLGYQQDHQKQLCQFESPKPFTVLAKEATVPARLVRSL